MTTVQELIDELKKMPGGHEVMSPDYGNNAYIVPQPHVITVTTAGGQPKEIVSL